MSPILSEQIATYNNSSAINRMVVKHEPEKENGFNRDINSPLGLIKAVRTIFSNEDSDECFDGFTQVDNLICKLMNLGIGEYELLLTCLNGLVKMKNQGDSKKLILDTVKYMLDHVRFFFKTKTSSDDCLKIRDVVNSILRRDLDSAKDEIHHLSSLEEVKNYVNRKKRTKDEKMLKFLKDHLEEKDYFRMAYIFYSLKKPYQQKRFAQYIKKSESLPDGIIEKYLKSFLEGEISTDIITTYLERITIEDIDNFLTYDDIISYINCIKEPEDGPTLDILINRYQEDYANLRLAIVFCEIVGTNLKNMFASCVKKMSILPDDIFQKCTKIFFEDITKNCGFSRKNRNYISKALYVWNEKIITLMTSQELLRYLKDKETIEDKSVLEILENHSSKTTRDGLVLRVIYSEIADEELKNRFASILKRMDKFPQELFLENLEKVFFSCRKTYFLQEILALLDESVSLIEKNPQASENSLTSTEKYDDKEIVEILEADVPGYGSECLEMKRLFSTIRNTRIEERCVRCLKKITFLPNGLSNESIKTFFLNNDFSCIDKSDDYLKRLESAIDLLLIISQKNSSGKVEEIPGKRPTVETLKKYISTTEYMHIANLLHSLTNPVLKDQLAICLRKNESLTETAARMSIKTFLDRNDLSREYICPNIGNVFHEWEKLIDEFLLTQKNISFSMELEDPKNRTAVWIFKKYASKESFEELVKNFCLIEKPDLKNQLENCLKKFFCLFPEGPNGYIRMFFSEILKESNLEGFLSDWDKKLTNQMSPKELKKYVKYFKKPSDKRVFDILEARAPQGTQEGLQLEFIFCDSQNDLERGLFINCVNQLESLSDDNVKKSIKAFFEEYKFGNPRQDLIFAIFNWDLKITSIIDSENHNSDNDIE